MNDFLGIYSDKFEESGYQVFKTAFDEANRRGQNTISYGHILKALKAKEPALFDKTLIKLKAESPLTDEYLNSLIEDCRQYSATISPDVADICRNAMDAARADNRRKIESSDLVLAIERIVLGVAPWLINK